MSNFKIGQKVVCIDASGNTLLTRDKIYTISSIKNNSCCGILTVKLEGVDVPSRVTRCICGVSYKSDIHYRASRFRPLKEQTTKINNVLSVKDIIKELVVEKSDIKVKEKV